jgi:outer membrane protein
VQYDKWPKRTKQFMICLNRIQAFDWKLIAFRCVIFAVTIVIWVSFAAAAELEIRIDNPPMNGTVIALLFNSASTFVDLRDPVNVVTLPSGGTLPGRIPDLPSGEYALVVYQDENSNGQLDKNFIGIPREPLGFSNSYWPQGPPAFTRAAFRLEEGETKTIDIKLQSVFGKLGLLGVGVGVILQTSPYRDSKHLIVQPIPAISYIGDWVQILGPTAQCGIMNWNDVRLAATASYRLGAYRESDSPYLKGMGDRDDTLMGGLALQVQLPAGFELSAGYEHDLLDRIGGGNGRIGLEKAFQQGLLTVSPQLALNWLTAELADYEYGVPADRVRDGRPAYHPSDSVNLEIGGTLFRELYDNWQIILTGSVIFLPSELTTSPIVDQAHVFNGFIAVTRLF